MNKTLIKLALALYFVSFQSAHASNPTPTLTLEGFEQPESVLAAPDGKHIYVSNINGSPVELDGNGYISKLELDGKQGDKKWATGFDAPKGLAVFGTKLYIADMQQLHIVDTQTGKTLKSVVAESSKMLNDITIDKDGVVYVSDFLGGGIYRYNGTGIEKWLDSSEFPHPNGLIIKDNTLYIAGWGHSIKPDFTTEKLGNIYSIALDDDNRTIIESSAAIGNLDGLVFHGENLIVSDWINGNIFSVDDSQEKLLFNSGKGSADIGSVGDKLYIPKMFDNRVDIYTLEP